MMHVLLSQLSGPITASGGAPAPIITPPISAPADPAYDGIVLLGFILFVAYITVLVIMQRARRLGR